MQELNLQDGSWEGHRIDKGRMLTLKMDVRLHGDAIRGIGEESYNGIFYVDGRLGGPARKSRMNKYLSHQGSNNTMYRVAWPKTNFGVSGHMNNRSENFI